MAPDVIEIAVEPKTSADREKLDLALTRLSTENPNFHFRTDHELGQTILKGAGELQLKDVVERIRREFNVEATVGAPQVAYRETLASAVAIDYTHKKQSSGTGEFGRVKIEVAPGERGSGVQFVDEVKGGNIPREYVPAIEKGMRDAAATGSLSGFPITDFEFHLVDGAYHDIDSSAVAFEVAGFQAMREAAQKAGIRLLEPIMRVEVQTPEECLGDVIGVFIARHAWLRGTESRGGAQLVTATAPMTQLFGFEEELKTVTEGEAVVEVIWDGYDFVIPNDTDPDDTFPAAAALRA